MLGNNGPGWLFCPADRPERFEKAAAAADVVILDLEDGVAAKDREAARDALIGTPLDPARTVVRVNPVGTPDFAKYQPYLTAKGLAPPVYLYLDKAGVVLGSGAVTTEAALVEASKQLR